MDNTEVFLMTIPTIMKIKFENIVIVYMNMEHWSERKQQC